MIISTAAGMLSLFHYCGDTAFQKHLKGESIHSAQNSRLQFLALGKSRQQEIDAAGHIIVLIQSREPWIQGLCQLSLGRGPGSEEQKASSSSY